VTATDDEYTDTYRRLQAKLLDRYGLIAQSRLVYLEALGTAIHVLEAGAGDPVVILHGGAGIGAEHIAVMAALSKRFRVIVPDRPGHGLSDRYEYRGKDLGKANVEFVEALFTELGLEKAVLVGNSYGGLMAVDFALAHPERVTRLVVLGFFPGINRRLPLMMRMIVAPVLGQILGATVGRPSEKSTRMFFSKLIVAHIDRMPDELIELETIHSRRHQRGIGQLFRNGFGVRGFRRRYLVGDALPGLRVPTSFLFGDHDAFMSEAEMRAVARTVPLSRFVLIPDAGHLASTDQPQRTADLLEKELRAVPSSEELRPLVQLRP
jgi:pimeloyl-ACP methyl ester carboxylesterase